MSNVLEILDEVAKGFHLSNEDVRTLVHELKVAQTALAMADKAHKELKVELHWFRAWEKQVRRFLEKVEEVAADSGEIDIARVYLVTWEALNPKPKETKL